MPVASARPDQNPRAAASQSGPEVPWPTGARWRVPPRGVLHPHRASASAASHGPPRPCALLNPGSYLRFGSFGPVPNPLKRPLKRPPIPSNDPKDPQSPQNPPKTPNPPQKTQKTPSPPSKDSIQNFNKPANQPTNQLTNQPNNQPTNQPTHLPTTFLPKL